MKRARAVFLAAGLAACRSPEADPGKAPSPAVAPASPKASEPSRLVGRWARTDGEYRLEIDAADPAGRLSARYLNPRPINVARAEWKLDEGRLQLLVELSDRLYPGSFYELTYDPRSDGLSGVYHHLGLHQDFDVAFYRLAHRMEGEGEE